MLLSINQTAAPTVEPVSLDQFKSQVRVDSTFTDDDTIMTMYLIAARNHAENYTRRSFFSQTWQMTLDHFPTYLYNGTLNPAIRRDWMYYSGIWNGMTIALPKGPVTAVNSIKYLDTTGTQQTLSSSNYTADLTSLPARIVPAPGLCWPLATVYVPGSVQVNFTAGSYVEDTDCPQTIAMAILLLASHWYEHREAVSEVSMKEVPFAVSALLDMYTVTVLDYDCVV